MYLDKIVNLFSGYIPPNLAKKSLGVMHHARWITLANRILRYYVCNPVVRAEGVETLARYVVQVYYKVNTYIYNFSTDHGYHFIDLKRLNFHV